MKRFLLYASAVVVVLFVVIFVGSRKSKTADVPADSTESEIPDSSATTAKQKTSGRVRFIVALDHSGSVTAEQRTVMENMARGIMQNIKNPNLISVVEFGSDVHLLGTADDEVERGQMLSAFSAFRPSLHWQYNGATNKLDITRPGDIAFTNITKLLDVLTEDARSSIEAGGLVCLFVLTDGDLDPPRKRGAKPGTDYLENEDAKRARILKNIGYIKKMYPNQLISRVVEVGEDIKNPGFVVDSLMAGFGKTEKAKDWTDVEHIISEVQRKTQGEFWLEAEPDAIYIPIASEDEPQKVGPFRFRLDGPDSGRFVAAAEAINSRINNHHLFGKVTVNDVAQTTLFTGGMSLKDGDMLTFVLYENPGNPFADNWIFSAGGTYHITISPQHGENAVSLAPKSATSQQVEMFRYGWLVRHFWQIVGYGFGSLLLLFVVVVIRVRRVRARRRAKKAKKNKPQQTALTVMHGSVRYDGLTYELDNSQKTIGDAEFFGRDNRVWIKPGNDFQIVSSGQEVRAGNEFMFSDAQATELLDLANRLIYVFDPITETTEALTSEEE